MLCCGEFLKNDPDLNVYQNIQRSGINVIVARPAVLPYSEIPRWEYKNVNTNEEVITNRKGTIISPLNVNNFHKIYKLPKPLVFLNKGLLKKFTMEKKNPLEII
jgi:hypothetical protein